VPLNAPSGELVVMSLALCTAGGVFVGLAWTKRRRWFWIAAAILFLVGIFLFYAAAFTE
jgi:hypothetical protein